LLYRLRARPNHRRNRHRILGHWNHHRDRNGDDRDRYWLWNRHRNLRYGNYHGNRHRNDRYGNDHRNGYWDDGHRCRLWDWHHRYGHRYDDGYRHWNHDGH